MKGLKLNQLINMISIDGSYGEGGGQILRYAASYAAAFNTKVEVYNIRVKRPNPGLRPQHMTLLKIMNNVFGGYIDGLYIGSTRVTMNFSKIKAIRGTYDIGTAGSISLILQALIPPLLLADSPSQFTLKGGTDVRWSPPIDYMKAIYSRLIQLYGGFIDIKIRRRGFYPRGGGIVDIYVEPAELKGWERIERNSISKVLVYNVVYKLSRHVLNRQRETIEKLIKGFIDVPLEVFDEYGRDSLDPGTSIVLAGIYDSFVSGGDSLGERGKPAEKVSEGAFIKFKSWYLSKASLDIHAGDMMIPIATLADSKVLYSVPEYTPHMDSAIYVAKLFSDKKIMIEKRQSYYVLSFR